MEERLKQLLKGDTSIVYIYEAPAKNTFRYRVYNMVQTINSHSRKLSASFFSTQELDHLRTLLSDIQIVVISRTRYTRELCDFVSLLRDKGVKIFFDLDDLLFDPDYTDLLINTLDLPPTEETWNHWFAFIGRTRASIQLCDAVITTNDYLRRLFADYFAKPSFVIPNFMNKEQLGVSERIFDLKNKSDWQRDEFITLGYFSGTQTHNKDFDIAIPALAELFKSNPNVNLKIAGHLSIKDNLEDFASRIEFIPFTDFVNLQTNIGKVDINLVPVQDNVFTNCKSELKYFEAAAVGTITVASPIFTYAQAIKNGETGFLAQSYEWLTKMNEAINVVKNKNHYKTMAIAAREDALSRYSWNSQAELIERTLVSI